MTDFVEVKTKAAAEKAIKAGKGLQIIAGSFSLTLANISVPIVVTGSADPILILEGTSAPSIVTRGTSAPSIETWGASAPRIVTRETSAPRIVTWETSAPSIDANGFSYVFTQGGRLAGKASPNVLLRIRGGAQIVGGQQFHINLSTNYDWCEYYGAPVEADGIVVLFKGVDAEYRSGHGGDYTPGTMPEADKWDGGKVECSHGLHWSPTPQHSYEFCTPARYIAAPHHIDDLVIHWDGRYPQKAMTRATAGPVFEVDIDGKPIPVEVQP